jgi:hypothetical protein
MIDRCHIKYDLHKIHSTPIYETLIKRIKAKTVFLDESFVVCSRVRDRVILSNLSSDKITDDLYGLDNFNALNDEMKIETKKSRFRTMGEINGKKVARLINLPESQKLKELESEVRSIKNDVRALQSNYRYVHPLSPKLIIGYQPKIDKELLELYTLKQALNVTSPTAMHSPLMQIQNGELVKYYPGEPIEQYRLSTVLKPYYAKKILSYPELEEEFCNQTSKLQTSFHKAKKACQNDRCKLISRKLKSIEQVNYLMKKWENKYNLFGQKLSGVKTNLKADGHLIDWPDHLVASIIEKDHLYDLRYGRNSVVSSFEVSAQYNKRIPIIALGRLHIFTDNLADTVDICRSLSEHLVKKFRPFSVYDHKLDPHYPSHNSIWWPGSI